MTISPLHLFDAIGVELEYMIVDRQTLNVKPICDQLFQEIAGEPVSDIEEGPIALSNELALHIVELKTNGPASSLNGLEDLFQKKIDSINGILETLNARLMPTAMHPWMNPQQETRLWSHENSSIYQLYDKIFDCSGHGWSNLQSMHLNLPFCGDEEFGRLHMAIRACLPLIPMLAASSPFQEGQSTGMMDTRLYHYALNQKRIPQITGMVIPEPVLSEQQYEEYIFDPIRQAIAVHDPEKLLDTYFLNSRGAIARFDRGAIEIRLIDLQESPKADLAVARLIVETVRNLAEERWSSISDQQQITTELLANILQRGVCEGSAAVISEREYLSLFGITNDPFTGGMIWKKLATELLPGDEVVEQLLQRGTLSECLVHSHQDGVSLSELYGQLCDDLDGGGFTVNSKIE